MIGLKPVIVRLKAYRKTASSSEKALIDYILKNSDQVAKISVQQLGTDTFTSPSTIVRLCRKIGFEGFKDFKKSLIVELTLQNKTSLQEEQAIEPGDTVDRIMDKLIYKHMMSIEETRTLIDSHVFEKCIELMHKVSTIYLFGMGSSYLVAKDLQQKLMRVNKPCVCFEDYHMQILQARNISAKDLAIVISYSGQTKEMITCSEMIQKSRAKSIAITRFGTSPIGELCDYTLFVTANEPLKRSGAMTSRIAQLCLVDMLYISYIQRHSDEAFQHILKTQLEKTQEERD